MTLLATAPGIRMPGAPQRPLVHTAVPMAGAAPPDAAARAIRWLVSAEGRALLAARGVEAPKPRNRRAADARPTERKGGVRGGNSFPSPGLPYRPPASWRFSSRLNSRTTGQSSTK
ncbi:hypothetical protein ACFQS7_20525 [Dankookia sp. GCM10030260]|uniref:hypothetical protein n=1 Tax=Dankookia sp. GCM10030260 TaxID=3273390 RepID=UPI0036100595